METGRKSSWKCWEKGKITLLLDRYWVKRNCKGKFLFAWATKICTQSNSSLFFEAKDRLSSSEQWREDEESVRGREISERVVRCNILMSISVVTLYFRARLPLRVRIRVNVDSYEKGFFFSSLPSFLSLFIEDGGMKMEKSGFWKYWNRLFAVKTYLTSRF